MKKINLVLIIFSIIISCNSNEKNFTFSTWTGAGNSFENDKWVKKLNYYDSLGTPAELFIKNSSTDLSLRPVIKCLSLNEF